MLDLTKNKQLLINRYFFDRKHNITLICLQFESWCFCGNVLKNYEIRPDTECNMLCAGNRTEICGGSWRSSVYDTMHVGKVAA